MVGKTTVQNAADRARFASMSEIPCIPCMISWWPSIPAEVQHVTEAGRRLENEHQNTYKMCEYHHRGVNPNGRYKNARDCEKARGPSFARSKADFIKRYGDEADLVQIQDALIRIVDGARDKGEYLTDMKLMAITCELHREIVQKIPPRPHVCLAT